jgi:hypothetical protein
LKPIIASRGQKNHCQFTERNGRKLAKAIHEEWTPDKGCAAAIWRQIVAASPHLLSAALSARPRAVFSAAFAMNGDKVPGGAKDIIGGVCRN